MSSKAKRMAEEIKPQATKTIAYRFDLKLDDAEKSCYMIVSGVPEGLPEELMPTVETTAKSQFAQVIKTANFIELYSLGKSAKEEDPVFYNLSSFKTISITKVEEVK